MKRILIAGAACLSLLACSPNTEQGVQFYKAEKYAQAREVFEKRTNDPVALVYLYHMYSDGQGVNADNQRAMQYLRDAVKLGDPMAQETLAGVLFRGLGNVPMDKEEALRLYEQAAQNGRKSAYVGIGQYYSSPPSSAERDEAKALQYYEKAAGTVLGDWTLAFAYEQGRGVRQDPQRSYQAIRSAAMAQGPEAEANRYLVAAARVGLAEYYFYGFGVDQNSAEAVKVAALAKEEHPAAAAFYAWLLFWGQGVKADPVAAVAIWTSQLEKAIKDRSGPDRIFLDAYALHGLAIAFQDGVGTRKDLSKLKQLGRKAAYGTSNAATWLELKYNALGYLDKKCDYETVHYGGEPGRYKPLKAEAILALVDCMPKSTLDEKMAAMELAGKAYELGNSQGAVVRAQLLTQVYKTDRAAYSAKLEQNAAMERITNKLFGVTKEAN